MKFCIFQRSMSTDCRIAWANITLPNGVSNNEPVDDWWPLSGKLGEELEGTVHLIITKKVCCKYTLFLLNTNCVGYPVVCIVEGDKGEPWPSGFSHMMQKMFDCLHNKHSFCKKTFQLLQTIVVYHCGG